MCEKAYAYLWVQLEGVVDFFHVVLSILETGPTVLIVSKVLEDIGE